MKKCLHRERKRSDASEEEQPSRSRTRAGLQAANQSSSKQNPSTSKTNPDVSEDRREDQLSPDPERLKQQYHVCREALDKNIMFHFTAELLTESGETSYRFKCPGPGIFQCALTGLVFVTTQEAELLYNTVQWDESLLQSAGRMAAGPLFDINVHRMEHSVSSTFHTVKQRMRCSLMACCLSSTSRDG
ncbi:hypothetical protein FQN60_013426 [Etheostoma spectabile]|uniref:FIIND domain-containing protein n=1 Tax=Etheostoma spectabile TaxID=54343 RepID=A0A5J5CFP7_9PERO|nr:hypothetical protein FQN60_013426 [Etheostoma spectabile]